MTAKLADVRATTTAWGAALAANRTITSHRTAENLGGLGQLVRGAVIEHPEPYTPAADLRHTGRVAAHIASARRTGGQR
jgi:hypothetical protein